MGGLGSGRPTGLEQRRKAGCAGEGPPLTLLCRPLHSWPDARNRCSQAAVPALLSCTCSPHLHMLFRSPLQSVSINTWPIPARGTHPLTANQVSSQGSLSSPPCSPWPPPPFTSIALSAHSSRCNCRFCVSGRSDSLFIFVLAKP